MGKSEKETGKSDQKTSCKPAEGGLQEEKRGGRGKFEISKTE